MKLVMKTTGEIFLIVLLTLRCYTIELEVDGPKNEKILNLFC